MPAEIPKVYAPEAIEPRWARFWVEQKLYRQSDEFSRDELESATVRLAELDLALKGGSRLASDLELQRALLDLSRPPGAV